MLEHLEKLDPLAYKQEACTLIDAVGIPTNLFDLVDDEKRPAFEKACNLIKGIISDDI